MIFEGGASVTSLGWISDRRAPPKKWSDFDFESGLGVPEAQPIDPNRNLGGRGRGVALG